MSQSQDLYQRACTLIPGGVNSPVRAFRSVGGQPFFTQSASGATLTTADNETLIDYVGTWGPAIHGHNHPAIHDAITQALSHGTSFGTPCPLEVQMAETLVGMVPSLERVRMVNSGTEATMSAIRLARGFTKRDLVIKFSGCYHGHVDGLLVKAGSGALTLGNPDSAGIPRAYAEQTLILPYNDLNALDLALAQHGEQIAALIVEPYPANCGLILPNPDYLQSLRERCTSHGIVLIFDEVMTGFRLAKAGVQELEAITPDITALGKIIGGGLPVGAFGGRADIMSQLAPEGPVYQAGTLSGNPLAMAAGLASLKLLQQTEPYAQLDASGKLLADALQEAAHTKGIALQTPQVGSMLCLFFSEKPVSNAEDASASETAQYSKLFHHALSHGIYLPPSAFETWFISTAHTQAQLEQTTEILTTGIKNL